jgi:2',3'-cyclic-nucleotide 2'-phosphodiesterase/3'-nucleotidase
VGTNIYAMVRFTNGRILLASKTEVILGKPDMPELTKEISNSDKLVQIIAEKDCVVNLTIGTKTYVSSKYVYEEASGKYIYSFETDRAISGTVIKVTATNAAGTSEELISSIIKTAPDQPQVNEVKAGEKVITGKVELLGDIENTQTRIFAKIGKKTYEGVVDHQGNYSIKIPSQVGGSVIKVWGTNKAGRGPLISVIVTK